MPPATLQEFSGHPLHAPLPVADLCKPGSQAGHAPPSAPVCPALHLQSAAASLAGGLEEFAPQLSHAASPGSVLNSPAAHAAHSPPSAPA